MFTGIIESMARILESGNGRLVIERPKAFSDLLMGSSIAIAGVCLTIASLNKKCIQFDVVPETLKRTTLGSYEEGNVVNLERAMKADGRFNGHIVQGHVEATAEAVAVERGKRKEESEMLLVVKVPFALIPNIVPKGSIALDGVSLTVASLDGDHLTIALIPHTLENTTLGTLKPGDWLNVETDVLARYATKLRIEN